MPTHCRHDGTEHPADATYCTHCGQPLRATVPPAAQPQLGWDVKDFRLPLNITVQWRSMDFSHQSERAPADRQRPLASAAQLAVLVHSREREDLVRGMGHPFGTKDELARVDSFLETPVQLAGRLDVRMGQMMTNPLAWTVAVRWGLVGSVVFDAATVMDIVRTIMRRLLWAIGCVLACFVLIKAMGGEGSPLWVVATCLVYLGVTRAAARLDERYSQGPPGPPPPETYS